MKLEYAISNMGEAFGQLEYAGEGNTEQYRVNDKPTILSRGYNLYSTIQRADDIAVILPSEVDEGHFESDEKARLIDPYITTEGYEVSNRGFTNYIMHADDMVKA